MTHAHTTSQALKAQIDRMVERNEDYVIDADGVDESRLTVINDFADGVWLCEHHDHCNMHRYTRVQRLA
jgi:hypothetical protein